MPTAWSPSPTALRTARCRGVVGQGVAALSPWLGAPPPSGCRPRSAGAPRAAEPPPAELNDARRAGWPAPARLRRRRAQPAAAGFPRRSRPSRVVWDAPFPRHLAGRRVPPRRRQPRLPRVQRPHARVADRPRPDRDAAGGRPARQPGRARAFLAARDVQAGALFEQRLLDADGRGRWVRATRQRVGDDAGRSLLLTVMQDSTAEHAAREARRPLGARARPLVRPQHRRHGAVRRTRPAGAQQPGLRGAGGQRAGAAGRGWRAAARAAVLAGRCRGARAAPGAPPLERQAWMPGPTARRCGCAPSCAATRRRAGAALHGGGGRPQRRGGA